MEKEPREKELEIHLLGSLFSRVEGWTISLPLAQCGRGEVGVPQGFPPSHVPLGLFQRKILLPMLGTPMNVLRKNIITRTF